MVNCQNKFVQNRTSGAGWHMVWIILASLSVRCQCGAELCCGGLCVPLERAGQHISLVTRALLLKTNCENTGTLCLSCAFVG